MFKIQFTGDNIRTTYILYILTIKTQNQLSRMKLLNSKYTELINFIIY